MKYILSIALFLISIAAFAQPLQYNPITTSPDGSPAITNFDARAWTNLNSGGVVLGSSGSPQSIWHTNSFLHTDGAATPSQLSGLLSGVNSYLSSDFGNNVSFLYPKQLLIEDLGNGHGVGLTTNGVSFDSGLGLNQYGPNSATINGLTGTLTNNTTGAASGATNAAAGGNIVTNGISWLPTMAGGISNAAFYVHGNLAGLDGFYVLAPGYVATNLPLQYSQNQILVFNQIAGTNLLCMNLPFNTVWAILSKLQTNSWGTDFYEWYVSSPTNVPQAGTLAMGNAPQVVYALQTNVVPSAIPVVAAGPSAPLVVGNGQFLDGVPLSPQASNTIATGGVDLVDPYSAQSYTNKTPIPINAGAAKYQWNNGDSIHGAIRRPFLMIYAAPYPSLTNSVATDNQTSVLAAVTFVATNGILGVITNFPGLGMDVVTHLDVGWDARRNFNQSFVITNCGTLWWDTNIFPLGIPWLIHQANLLGEQMSLGMYGNTNYLPHGVAGGYQGNGGWAISVQGNTGLVGYTNGVGPGGFVYSNTLGGSTYKYVEGMTPDNMPYDESELAWWGAYFMVANDFPDSIDQIMILDNYEANASDHWIFPAGLNPPGAPFYNGTPAGYYNYNFAGVGSGLTPNETRSVHFNLVHQLGIFGYETTWMQSATYGDLTRRFHNGVNYENFDFSGGVPNNNGGAPMLRQVRRDFPSCKSALDGAYLIGTFSASANNVDGQSNYMVSVAMLSACPVVNCPWGTITNVAAWASLMTNGSWARIECDSLQAFPILYANNDYTTNVGSAWIKPLASGEFAAAAFNENYVNTTNITINFPDSATGKPVSVVDGWNGKSYGIYYGSFTASNIPPTNSAWFVCSPLTSKMWVNVLTTNVASTNLATGPLSLNLTINGTYIVTMDAVAVGTNSATPGIMEWVTNSVSGGNELMASTFTCPQALNSGWGQSFEANNSSNIPLSSSPGTPWGTFNGITPVVFSRGFNGNVTVNACEITSIIQVTNAPLTIFAEAESGTGTNTLYAGASISATLMK